MDIETSKSTIADMAYLLKSRKDNRNPTVLFVGARAGGLFRSRELYNLGQLYTNRPSFRRLPLSEQFSECFKVLMSDRLGEADRHNLLIDSLRNQSFSPADVALASLVKEGVFDIIISTNIDGLLQEAFNSVNLRPGLDYQVRIPQRFFYSESESIFTGSKPTLIKVFGDLAAHQYRTKPSYLRDYRDLRRDLGSYLRRDILLIGFDPTWDQEIDDSFPFDEGQSVWYVDEDLPAGTSRIARALDGRSGMKRIIGAYGTYANFLPTLHNLMQGAEPLHGQAPTAGNSTPNTRKSSSGEQPAKRINSQPPRQSTSLPTLPDAPAQDAQPPSHPVQVMSPVPAAPKNVQLSLPENKPKKKKELPLLVRQTATLFLVIGGISVIFLIISIFQTNTPVFKPTDIILLLVIAGAMGLGIFGILNSEQLTKILLLGAGKLPKDESEKDESEQDDGGDADHKGSETDD